MSSPEAPVSWGELIDKVTIFEIKRKRLKRPEALANVAKELSLLSALADGAIADRADVMSLKRRLAAIKRTINLALSSELVEEKSYSEH